ncbi:hypothetical protein COU77_01890 [Candidatus Peregrinibacteria bacterium CG10_big_fil_rev_8_21_14_0_10_49_16]|nr:MAG: hypothetical protein COW95_04085 [Candidatus Peregrinibacteria bacterium CG22_combo_CG10-13_8_21_14_all_49_11]PIR52138.1 MAG: hypothetical protein COU77_01890 [Candidatus Peregrinibacteria bacterium CG10_big_fil_rev_8_21_14_0_10_49_16]
MSEPLITQVTHHPFPLLRAFKNTLDVFLLTKEDDIQNDQDVQKATGCTKTASLHQIHGDRMVIAREPMERGADADGLLTDTLDLLLSIRTADCQPILVYAPEKNVIGLMHVGWKGLVARTIPSFFKTLKEEWNVDPQDSYVCIGPSMRQCCAEYREEDHLLREFDESFWKGTYVDLAGIADQQLLNLGVQQDRIECHADCTCCHPKTYWTYRGGDRQKVQEGHTNVLAARLRD